MLCVFLINYCSMKTYVLGSGGITPFLTSALGESEWSASRPFYFVCQSNIWYELSYFHHIHHGCFFKNCTRAQYFMRKGGFLIDTNIKLF
jgi:hypothetical protein